VAYCQAEATGAGSSDFAREKCENWKPNLTVDLWGVLWAIG